MLRENKDTHEDIRLPAFTEHFLKAVPRKKVLKETLASIPLPLNKPTPDERFQELKLFLNEEKQSGETEEAYSQRRKKITDFREGCTSRR